jgi:hypothetical protein
MNLSKNLILAFATNIKPERVRILAQSLREVYSTKECDVVIYIDKLDHELKYLSQQYSVEFIYTESLYSYDLDNMSKLFSKLIVNTTAWMSKTFNKSSASKFICQGVYPSLIKTWCHPQLIRWIYFRDFLRTHQNYKKVLISDAKDVIFQSSFFDLIDDNELYLTEQSVEYGKDNYDTNWYVGLYGKKELKKVEGLPALCCATVLGGIQPIREYLDAFVEEILQIPFSKYTEQPIFNHVYYSNRKSKNGIRLLKNDGEVVLHATGPRRIENFKVSADGVLRKDGQCVPIIHAWDRTETIFNYVSDKFDLQGIRGYAGGYVKR